MGNKWYRDLDKRLNDVAIKTNRIPETGYPVVSTFPTGVSAGFICYHTAARDLFEWDGTYWWSLAQYGKYISSFLTLPVLRAFWPLNSVDNNTAAYDLSSQGRTLTNTNGAVGVYNSRISYIDYNGTTAFHARADEAALSITGGMVAGGWFWHDTQAASQVLFGKWNPTGNQRTWMIDMSNGSPDTWRFSVSGNGTNTFTAGSAATVDVSAWHMIVGRYTPSSEVSVFVDGVKATFSTSIPASIFDSTADLRIGALGDGTTFFDGRAVNCFVCATGSGGISDAMIVSLYNEGKVFFQ